jgi:putative membrane protein
MEYQMESGRVATRGNSGIPGKLPAHGCRFNLVVLAAILAISSATPANAAGSLTAHMVSHIALMNFLAPLMALAAITSLPPVRIFSFSHKGMLLSATISQIATLWAAHTPAVLTFSTSNALSHAALQGLLLLVAIWFWGAVFTQPPRHFWRALLALLFTAKLFCLLGALLVFAPRSLYSSHSAHSAGGLSSAFASDDQQLAGLLMLLACPLSYVVAGIVISSRALRALEAMDDTYVSPTIGVGRTWPR